MARFPQSQETLYFVQASFPVHREWATLTKGLFSGDSFSSVTLQTRFTEDFHPDSANPLAVEFPGVTYNEPGQPNWVGHLITKYFPGPRLNPGGEQDGAHKSSPLLVYNYARGGDHVMGVKRQIQTLFLPTVGQKPPWGTWSENDSLFGMWHSRLSARGANLTDL